jgi:hypothetical protein
MELDDIFDKAQEFQDEMHRYINVIAIKDHSIQYQDVVTSFLMFKLAELHFLITKSKENTNQ